MDQASSNYLEAILEIEEIKLKSNYKDFSAEKRVELDSLEVSCRSNYSNVKAKENDWDIVKTHAQEILKIEPNNGKGNFRLGQALFHLKRYELAMAKLTIAK